jgi:hypothetical protein
MPHVNNKNNNYLVHSLLIYNQIYQFSPQVDEM